MWPLSHARNRYTIIQGHWGIKLPNGLQCSGRSRTPRQRGHVEKPPTFCVSCERLAKQTWRFLSSGLLYSPPRKQAWETQFGKGDGVRIWKPPNTCIWPAKEKKIVFTFLMSRQLLAVKVYRKEWSTTAYSLGTSVDFFGVYHFCQIKDDGE